MDLEMSVEIASLGEPLTADMAGELVAGVVRLVDQLVGLQDPLSFESLVAGLTLESFLQFMNDFDVIRDVILGEILGTDLALSDPAEFE